MSSLRVVVSAFVVVTLLARLSLYVRGNCVKCGQAIARYNLSLCGRVCRCKVAGGRVM